MFRFADPTWLWALALVPALGALAWLGARARRRALERFADAALLDRLAATVHVGARRWKLALVLIAVALLAIAAARPQFGNRVETVRSVGQDVVVALDLSESMLAEDVPPSRLERARLSVLRLMRQLDGDRIGLVAFAADAFVQSPLTVDYSAAGMFLGAMDPDLMPVQGTDLGEALRVSIDALEQGAREARVLLLVTDAEDHEGAYEEQLRRARDMGVRLYVVVVGTEDGAPIPVYDESGARRGFLRDEDGSVVTTKVDGTVLERLSREGGATVVRVGSGGTELDALVDEIARGEGEEIDARQVTRFEEQYQIFLGLAFLLLLTETMITDRRRVEGAWSRRFE